MSDFRRPTGFEDALRPPVDTRRARLTPSVIGPSRPGVGSDAAARLVRFARAAPEVMVKITGRTRDGGHLRAHLDYISRNGGLALEGPDGERLDGRAAVRAAARDWSEELAIEPGRRRDSSVSMSIVLSMPRGVDPRRLEDAARAFATDLFGGRFPYVFVLHDEGRHPHVHLSVRSLGHDGARLNPRKADLQVWREQFARRLRERDIPAEATPRRARAVGRKAERTPVRKMRERFVAGKGPLPDVLAGAYRAALEPEPLTGPWLAAIRDRERSIREAMVAEARRLKAGDPGDRLLGGLIERLVRARPMPETRDQALRRQARDRDGPERADR